MSRPSGRSIGLAAALIALVCLPVVLIFKGHTAAQVWPVVIACTAAALLIRLPDIEFFRLGPLETRMREAAEEAKATLAQLRETAAALASPALTSIARSNRLAMPDTGKLNWEEKDNIISNLRDLKVDEHQISHSLRQFYRFTEIDLFCDIIDIIREKSAGLGENTAGLIESSITILRLDYKEVPPAEIIRESIKEFSILDDELEGSILDLESFQKTETLRRPEVFFGRI